jgi:hypothetical protein
MRVCVGVVADSVLAEEPIVKRGGDHLTSRNSARQMRVMVKFAPRPSDGRRALCRDDGGMPAL